MRSSPDLNAMFIGALFLLVIQLFTTSRAISLLDVSDDFQWDLLSNAEEESVSSDPARVITAPIMLSNPVWNWINNANNIYRLVAKQPTQKNRQDRNGETERNEFRPWSFHILL
ncbi:hypothetical protein Tcan_04923 [Toxocara canis]|uniref:Uncharacterized protein n=1 Tax=Toxocara canis TaxID=6265 RepID=A0A0B2VT62_TOXCA|nr:hypothetical protein Tcan_04923 [Toxocara canis]